MSLFKREYIPVCFPPLAAAMIQEQILVAAESFFRPGGNADDACPVSFRQYSIYIVRRAQEVVRSTGEEMGAEELQFEKDEELRGGGGGEYRRTISSTVEERWAAVLLFLFRERTHDRSVSQIRDVEFCWRTRETP